MFRYTRLPFEISCAPEIFQGQLEQMLSEIPKVMNFQDDIVIWGNSEEEHDTMYAKVMGVMNENNVMLADDKLILKVTEAEFIGHRLTTKGVSPTNSKIVAVQTFRIPETREELRSFLGLISFVGRFISNLSDKTHVLRELCKNEKFPWTNEHQQAFERLKDDITRAPTLSYFSNNRPTRLVADASP